MIWAADFIFQQDTAAAHTAKGTKSWFNDYGVTVLDWPANSPDLNPIENLWGINNNNNVLHLHSAFLGTQSALHRRGEYPQPPPMCSIHLDDATAAILRQNAHHTPAYWWRGDRVMKPIGVWGLLGGHDGQRYCQEEDERHQTQQCR